MHNVIDTNSVDNVIEKLQVYMQRNNQTMHGLANTMKFAYQPFYRLMTKKSLPTIDSLNNIAGNLKCTVSELTGSDIFLDIPCYTSIDNYLTKCQANTVRIYIPYAILKPIVNEEFVIIQTTLVEKKIEQKLNNINYYLNTQVYQLFSTIKKIDIDGFFWVRYKNTVMMLEVLSISSTVITANYEDKVTSIPVAELETYAKFINYIELPNQFETTLRGREL